MKTAVLFLLIYICMSKAITAQDYAVSVKASTLGVHAELYRALGSSFNIHLGAASFNYAYDKINGTKGQYSLSADIKLKSYTALIDWKPFTSSSFKFTGGAVFNDNHPSLTAIPEISKTIGGDIYNQASLGNMKVDLTVKKINPYFGIGFGNVTSGKSGLGLTLDAGAYYQDSPKVKLSANGLLAPSASPEQAAILQNNLKWIKWYPVVSLGLVYTF